MAGIADFIMGRGALKKAGGTPDTPASTPAETMSSADMLKRNQAAVDSANAAKSSASVATPAGSKLSTTMTPQMPYMNKLPQP